MTYDEYLSKMGHGEYDYNSLASRIDNIENVAKTVYEDMSSLQSDKYIEGVSIVSEVSKQLYARNAESEIYHRGVYDIIGTNRGARDDYANFEGSSPSWPVKSISNAFDDPNVSSVEVSGDVLVAWAPSRQIAKTFSAGGGMSKSEIAGQAILQTSITTEDVAFYWPAIYRNIGSSIDTKEVWVINADGTYEISREQWEQL